MIQFGETHTGLLSQANASLRVCDDWSVSCFSWLKEEEAREDKGRGYEDWKWAWEEDRITHLSSFLKHCTVVSGLEILPEGASYAFDCSLLSFQETFRRLTFLFYRTSLFNPLLSLATSSFQPPPFSVVTWKLFIQLSLHRFLNIGGFSSWRIFHKVNIQVNYADSSVLSGGEGLRRWGDAMFQTEISKRKGWKKLKEIERIYSECLCCCISCSDYSVSMSQQPFSLFSLQFNSRIDSLCSGSEKDSVRNKFQVLNERSIASIEADGWFHSLFSVPHVVVNSIRRTCVWEKRVCGSKERRRATGMTDGMQRLTIRARRKGRQWDGMQNLASSSSQEVADCLIQKGLLWL